MLRSRVKRQKIWDPDGSVKQTNCVQHCLPLYFSYVKKNNFEAIVSGHSIICRQMHSKSHFSDKETKAICNK